MFNSPNFRTLLLLLVLSISTHNAVVTVSKLVGDRQVGEYGDMMHLVEGDRVLEMEAAIASAKEIFTRRNERSKHSLGGKKVPFIGNFIKFLTPICFYSRFSFLLSKSYSHECSKFRLLVRNCCLKQKLLN